MKENLIQQKSFSFAINSISLYKRLIKENEFVLSRQFIKSATSIGANVEEALAGISRRDFIAKMSIASKEARETRYWIRLLEKSDLVDYNFKNAKNDIEEIIRLLTSIVKTSQKSTPN